MTVVTGCFVKKYQVWTSPANECSWVDNKGNEARPKFMVDDKPSADLVVEVLTWAKCKNIRIEEKYEPVPEIPLLDKEA